MDGTQQPHPTTSQRWCWRTSVTLHGQHCKDLRHSNGCSTPLFALRIGGDRFMSTARILLAGDVEGNLATLFKRVDTVNNKSGPFDVLFCVGGFFPNGPAEEDDSDDMVELWDYLSGTKTAPIPTYFIGSFGRGSRKAMAAMSAAASSSAASNVHYLGRAGVVTLHGLNVAFLDGLYDETHLNHEAQAGAGCRYYTREDVTLLKSRLNQMEGEVDLLLTCEWPMNLTGGLAPASLPEGLRAACPGSSTVAEVAVAARPRYHVAGTLNTFFARPPYMNRDLGAGVRATRFVGLAAVVSSTKQKSLHALALQPATGMDPEALAARPEGATPSPLQATAGTKRAAPADEDLGGQDWRWQTKKARGPGDATPWGKTDVVKDNRKSVYVKNLPYAASYQDVEGFFLGVGEVVDIRRGVTEGRLNGWAFVQFESVEAAERALQLGGTQLMGRDLFVETAVSGAAAGGGGPVEGCWFCLSSQTVDTALVVSVGQECYVALDKGAITPQHALLVPIEHQPSLTMLGPDAVAELERYLSALRSCFAAQGKELVAFERFLTFKSKGGNHCHVNVLAIPTSAAKGARAEFQRMAKAAGFEFKALPPPMGTGGLAAIRDVVGDGEYFLAILPDGSRLVHPIMRGERFPLNLGREVLAALAGQPERADWKACQADAGKTQQMVEDLRKAFQPYDIMQA